MKSEGQDESRFQEVPLEQPKKSIDDISPFKLNSLKR